MAKTINSEIDIFETLKSAQTAFDKSKVPCMLLEAPRYKAWFVDKSKQAIIDWPTKYVKLAEK